ncbi:MAG: 3-dehydroquinate synthase, partial [Chlamydiae bacterium]|nr:3-dehydroquinate synthase [Chlamydiota bacterium]
SGFIEGLCQKFTGKKVVIAETLLQKLYGMDLARRIKAERVTLPQGEAAKTFASLQGVLNTLFSLGCDRDTLLIALGGGATLDLVGFVASIYLRGVATIFLPTTLLAMVDASIGGKNGIDTAFGKNLVGTLYSPEAIVVDKAFLKTLPCKEKLMGLMEVLKLALVWDRDLWELCKGETHLWIERAIQGKIEIVEKDPTEKGLRRILNFGHTVGHALEKITDYRLAHGEAVALGCLAESYLSFYLGILPAPVLNEIVQRYTAYDFKLPREATLKALKEAMRYDKKQTLGKTRVVVIEDIGKVLSCEGNFCLEIEDEVLEAMWQWMEENYGRHEGEPFSGAARRGVDTSL